MCLCVDGYQGVNCEIDQCTLNPCQNGGSGCYHDSGKLLCTCPIEYRGNLCEYDNPFTLDDFPIAYYSFSSKNKLLDQTGNGHDLAPFLTESMDYPLNYDQDNQALTFFTTDIVGTSSSSITLGNSFSISVVFSISKFSSITTLVLFSPTDVFGVTPLTITISYIFLFIYFILFFTISATSLNLFFLKKKKDQQD